MRKSDNRRARSWVEADPNDKNKDGWFQNEHRLPVAMEGESDFIETGILDVNGRPICRRVKSPIGFIRFGTA